MKKECKDKKNIAQVQPDNKGRFCPPCGESTAKRGKGVLNLNNPPSALQATSCAREEVNRGFTRCRHPELVCASSRSMKGFTLIELLVVVLIIGILAAVAFPQYQKAVEKSRMTEALQLADSIQKNCEIHVLEKGLPEDDAEAFNYHQFYSMNNISVLKGKDVGPGRYCNQPTCWATTNFLYGGLCFPDYCTFSITRVKEATQNPVTDNAGLYRIDLTYRPESGWTKSYTQLNSAAVNLQSAFRTAGYQ